MRLIALWLLFALAAPSAALAQDGPGDAVPSADEDVEPTESPEGSTEAADDVETDPLEAPLRELVTRYYRSIGSDAAPADLDQGVRSVKLMLIDGVSLDRIEAAVDAAIALHTPGRRIPFQVAVPLRVRPAGEEARPAPRASSGADSRPARGAEDSRRPPPPPELADREPREDVQPGDDAETERAGSAIEARWVKRQEELRARRNRLRLYLQWRDRTKEKRVLLGVGVPILVGGWAATWGLAGATLTVGETLPSVGWTGAIPIVGPFIFGALTNGEYPPVFVFAGFQGIGLALTIAGLAQRHDLPYDRDPTAFNIGRDRRTGRAVMTISPRPVGLGAGVTGRF